MDSDTTGKLSFEEFKYSQNNIKKWQAIYKQFCVEGSGTHLPPRVPSPPSTPTSRSLYDPSSASVPSRHLHGFRAPKPFSQFREGPSSPCAPWHRCAVTTRAADSRP